MASEKVSHKSPSSQRWLDNRETRDILATRRAQSTPDPLRSRWPDSSNGLKHPNGSARRLGSYHWRQLHKNLARPLLRTRNVKIVEPAVWTNG